MFPAKPVLSAHAKRRAKYDLKESEILEAFKNTNFGESPNHRALLAQGCLKRVAGYSSGHTLTTIMRELGLTSKKDVLTVKGRDYLFQFFYNPLTSG